MLFFSAAAPPKKLGNTGPEISEGGAPLIDKAVVVTPFNDQRINENSNMVGMYLIPLMPFGWQDLNTPEGVSMHVNSALWLWRPNEDIAKATSEELNNSRIFREAFYSTRASEGDLVLQGTIKSSKYKGKIITYGLSVEGPILWLIGLPATNISNELVIAFKLEDHKNNRTLWEKEYREEISKTSVLYYLRSDFDYPDMLKKMLLNVVRDMKAEVPSIRNRLSTSESLIE